MIRTRVNEAILEFILLLVVLMFLVWKFSDLSDFDGDVIGDRYKTDESMQVGHLDNYGQADLSILCAQTEMPARLKWRWANACKDIEISTTTDLAPLVKGIQADYEAMHTAIILGESERRKRIEIYSKSLAEDVLSAGDQKKLKENLKNLNQYRAYFKLDLNSSNRRFESMPLSCAWQELQAQLNKATTLGTRVIIVANQFAVIRGVASRIWFPELPVQTLSALDGGEWSDSVSPDCLSLGKPREVIRQASNIVEHARVGEKLHHKAIAMKSLQVRAPWLLFAWSIIAWFLLSLVRNSTRPIKFLPLALITWALCGASSGLTLADTGLPMPMAVWGGMAALAILIWIASYFLPLIETMGLFRPSPPQRNLLFFSFPFFVCFIGIGWWLVFDLAMNGHYRNRYIALTQQLPIFFAFVLITILPAFSFGIAKLWMRWSSFITNVLRPHTSGILGGWLRPVLVWLIYALIFIVSAVLLKNWRQFTGEALRWWLLLGVSWFFLLRADRWTTERSNGWRSLLLSMLPMFVYVIIVMFAFLITDDLGPLLVVLFASVVYFGAFAAQATLGRGSGILASFTSGVIATICSLTILVGALYSFSKLPISPAKRVAERVESAINPFSAENDQLAHVLWFQKHTPANGYGFGAVPWCGTLPSETCQGVPAQTQSDYTFSAFQGVFGFTSAVILLITYITWLALLAVRHAAQTNGVLNLSKSGASESAWLAWLAVCWAVLTVTQTLVTVMGNLGVLPLTGVTWAFLSFGSWSLLGNTIFLGLVIHKLETAE